MKGESRRGSNSGAAVQSVPPPPRPRRGRKGFSSVWTSGTYRGGQFSTLHENGLVLCESLPDRHLPTVDFHEGVVQVAVASYPVEHCLHVPPYLHVRFPMLEDLRVRKLSQFLTSAPGMTEEALNCAPAPSPPSGRKTYSTRGRGEARMPPRVGVWVGPPPTATA